MRYTRYTCYARYTPLHAVTFELERARRAVTEEESCWKKTITSGRCMTHALYSKNEMIPSCA